MTEFGYIEEPISPVGHDGHAPPTPQAGAPPISQAGAKVSTEEATVNPPHPSTAGTTQHVQSHLSRANSSQTVNNADERDTNADQDTPSTALDYRQTHTQDYRQTHTQDYRQTHTQDCRQTQNQDYQLVQRQDYKNKYFEAKRFNQDLIDNVQEQGRKLDEQSRKLEAQNRLLREQGRQMDTALSRNQNMAAEIDRLRHDNDRLAQQNDDLRAKYNKKAESYRDLDKNYMDLVRNIQVTDDDHSTIFQGLTNIRTTIENLIQKARRSASMNRELAIEHFRNSEQPFPVPEANLEPYHLDLYMESAIMLTLIRRFFVNPLGCIFSQSEMFESLSNWVDQRDSKVAERWRQQLCNLLKRDPDAVKHRNEAIVKVSEELVHLVFSVYTDVDMSSKIHELCTNAFDLSFAMYGMEHKIYPTWTQIGERFDDETMSTPQRSNPDGNVSLLIFHAFTDKNNVFKIPPKVWCL
ncbi:hypothetical protein BGX26_005223 [Mortierella sp. AD094]|nr:hypothetical protein BGX26_005223 [Mortierella sp. AD094]